MHIVRQPRTVITLSTATPGICSNHALFVRAPPVGTAAVISCTSASKATAVEPASPRLASGTLLNKSPSAVLARRDTIVFAFACSMIRPASGIAASDGRPRAQSWFAVVGSEVVRQAYQWLAVVPRARPFQRGEQAVRKWREACSGYCRARGDSTCSNSASARPGSMPANKECKAAPSAAAAALRENIACS